MQSHVRNIYRSKTHYSREIARIFKIAGFFLLIPTLPGALISLLLITWGGFIPLTVITFGLILFGGYIAHCNHNLKQNMVFWLWIGTIIYNGVPLIFTVKYAIPFILEKQAYSAPNSEISTILIFLLSLCLIWLASFILATVALSWTLKASKYEF